VLCGRPLARRGSWDATLCKRETRSNQACLAAGQLILRGNLSSVTLAIKVRSLYGSCITNMSTMSVGRALVLPVVLSVAALASGCSMTAPKYTASLENVQKLKDGEIQPAKVGAFHSEPGKDNEKTISLRGSTLASPYDDSYAAYLAEALKQELSMAGKLAPDAQIEVSGALQKNDINIPISTGTGDITARFTVTRGGTVRYDQVKTIHETWDSSFLGAVAIPRAQEEYPVMVQKLLAELYADPAFIQALK
jgi:hypothetical protein